MTEKGFRIVSDVNKEGWEKSDFPILCETCLGDNPYVRMTRNHAGFECQICTRPFTCFRWKAGSDGRHKVTILCQTCAKLKNVCQCCVFDLEYGLPVQVRDKYLAEHEQIKIPESDVNRDYFIEQLSKQGDAVLPYGKSGANPALQKMARLAPYYKRNQARICSFFVKGECTRGAECPYRHELPEGGELANQNVKDRFYGHNDPVAKKILNTNEKKATLTPPEDQSITTLYLGGLDATIEDQDVRDKLEEFYVFSKIFGDLEQNLGIFL